MPVLQPVIRNKQRDLERFARLVEGSIANLGETAEIQKYYIPPSALVAYATRPMRASRRRARTQTAALDAIRKAPPPSPPRRAPQARLSTVGRVGEFLDNSPTAKFVAGEVGSSLGLVPGAARRAGETLVDLGEGAVFTGRLFNPLDPFYPRELSARRQLADGVAAALGHVGSALDHPDQAWSNLQREVNRQRARLDPTAAPQADTVLGEVARNYEIGQNHGAIAFDLGTLALGAGELRAAAAAGAKLAPKALRVAKYMNEWGLSPQLAEYFALPYEGGMGSHFIPRRIKWIPKWYMDSPLNVINPRNMDRGEFYRLHYSVDPKYDGGAVRRDFGGGGWSGKQLGWQKHDRLGRFWHGAPPALKQTVLGGLTVGEAVPDGPAGTSYMPVPAPYWSSDMPPWLAEEPYSRPSGY